MASDDSTAPTGKVQALDLPFDEAIAHLKDKVRLPTDKWTDLWEGMHTRAFVVAGATKDELLADLQAAVLRALEQGATLDDFRKDFDQAVGKAGWDFKGGRDWRSRVILETNLRTAYAAGRYQQMKDVAAERPYWEYRHGDSRVPRPEHQAWDGLILPADDPWWDTHYPPNGWGCSCTVVALSKRDLEKMGKKAPDQAPPTETYTFQPKDGSPAKKIPVGIDPGWAYNVGKAAHGPVFPIPEAVQQAAKSPGVWKTLTPGNWKSAGAPAELPADPAKAKPGPAAKSAKEIEQQLAQTIGGQQGVFDIPAGDHAQKVVVDANLLAQQVAPEHASAVPLLPELLSDPAEVWLTFEQHQQTGQVVLHYRVVKRVADDAHGDRVMVADVQQGHVVGWTFASGQDKTLAQYRTGKLIFSRE